MRERNGSSPSSRYASPGPLPPVSAAEKVAENLYMIPGQGGNTAAFVTANGVVLVDTKLANNGEPIRPGHAYLAPADYHLLVEPGRFALSTEAPVTYARPSIDVLFQTAADAYREALLGVLLTGASADGAEGLAAVKAYGGRAIVEDPATAECRTMPAAALAATAVDYVLPLSKIGEYLVTLVEGTRA